MEKAREEVEKTVGAKHDKLAEQIALLEQKLAEAHTNRERAISRAQMTRSGHVYIISNIGSFGENVFKVGMTRRLEPMDRVKELGDASVPFAFDVHAIIFSEDAPGLENALHRAFDGHRVNLVNDKKEFFSVSIDRIVEIVEKHCGKIELTRIAMAEEFRKTQAARGAGVQMAGVVKEPPVLR